MLAIFTVAQLLLGLFLILIFNSLKAELKSEKLLFWYLILLMFREAVGLLGTLDAVIVEFPYIILINQPLYYLDAFFLYLFVKSILGIPLISKRTYIALIPLVIYTGYMFYLAMGVTWDEELIAYLLEINGNKQREIQLDGIVYILTVITYNIIMYAFSYYLLQKNSIKDNIEFKVINQLNIRWQKQLITWWFLLICLPVTIILLLLLLRVDLDFDYELLSPIGILLLTFVFGWRKIKIKIAVLKESNIPVTVESLVKEAPKYGTMKLSPDRVQEINNVINTAVKEEKIYLQAELNLTTFAEKFNEKPYLISQVINTIHDKSFQDFMNSHRIDHARDLLQNNPNYKIIHIAFDSGFKSKSTFNQHFKNKTGLTPTQYKKNILKDNLLDS